MKDTEIALGEFFNILPDAVIVVDSSGVIAFANHAVNDLLGYEPERLVDQPLALLVPERFRERHARHLSRFRAEGKATGMGARPLLSVVHETGVELPVSISIANVELGGIRYSIALLRDAADVQAQINSANVKAHTDLLTGLGNRMRLSHEIQLRLSALRPFSVLFLDLRHFKPFNDLYGHETGDRVLQIVATRIVAQIRPTDTAVRFGGDEFVVLLDDLEDPVLLCQRAVALSRALTRPMHLGAVTSTVGINIGGAGYPRDAVTEEALIKVADRNMYRAKAADLDYCADAGTRSERGDDAS